MLNHKDILMIQEVGNFGDYKVFCTFPERTLIGRFIKLENGFYIFSPIQPIFRQTLISSTVLKAIADYLDELNEEWWNET